jgi:ankyrin repeat protein
LLIAAENGHEKVVKVLLDSGAEKEAKEKGGRTALHIAAQKGHERIVTLLQESGAEK